ncbi:MAG: hypothetical protein JNN12_00240 [Bacteroidetes Order II. Incertae sedis bacterium]|nr:hypothetical protein [Bacteroidetes Order II. bacterium]
MKVLKLVKRGFLGFITCIVLFYSWFYLSAKKPIKPTEVPKEVLTKMKLIQTDSICRSVKGEDGFFTGEVICINGISYNRGRIFLNKKAVPNNIPRISGGFEYISDKVAITINSPSMFGSFWKSLLLPSHENIQIRRTGDLSLLHSFRIWKTGTYRVPYKNDLYYLCGEDYANAHNKDIMTLPVSEFCKVDMGQSFE